MMQKRKTFHEIFAVAMSNSAESSPEALRTRKGWRSKAISSIPRTSTRLKSIPASMAWFDRWLKGQPEWWFDLYANR
jgi:hypothetical protein